MRTCDERCAPPATTEGPTGSNEPDPPTKRDWSPGFMERLLQRAEEVDIEVPERLPSNPDREKILDELAKD